MRALRSNSTGRRARERRVLQTPTSARGWLWTLGLIMPQPPSLSDWLAAALPSSAPASVVAYNFNMAECGDWIVDVIGASSYDENDRDWACPPEAWTSNLTDFTLKRDTTCPNWEAAQAYASQQITNFLKTSKSPAAEVLRSAQAVCVGFVDGDLVKVWPAR